MIAGRNKIILGSASPRRKQLLESLFPRIEVRVKDVDEIFPEHLAAEEIPLYLSEKKSGAFDGEIQPDEILITADTIVWFDNHVLNKPPGGSEALMMLRKLSGKTHQVFTGVCIRSTQKRKKFYVESKVEFVDADDALLAAYIQHYQPFDKAGAYGAQECLPEGVNPLSEKEKRFLSSIGQPELFEKSLAVKHESKLALIKKIDGSYFNVMGLPIAELSEMLEKEF